jgi:hypothetical protein
MTNNPVPARPSKQKKIWIDLDNTPHVPFFVPIMEELRRRGYSVVLSARDCFQVCGLADLFRLPYRRVGRHYGKNKVMKAYGMIYRSLQLLPMILREKPDLALSHGSRSQVIAAKVARIPSLAIFDYEFGKRLPGVRATKTMAPELVAAATFDRHGGTMLKYPGIKEDVYVPTFQPDPGILGELGLSETDIIVTLRPPADEAHYHNPESEVLLAAVIDLLSRAAGAKVVLVPRNERQGAAIQATWPSLFAEGRIRIPSRAVDGLNLMWHSDLVISGGGTMNREAAALGVPVYSIFRGRIGAVDRHLADTGRLVLLQSAEEVRAKLKIMHRDRAVQPQSGGKSALTSIVDQISEIVERGAAGA